jgi:hypothetical protein
MNIQNMILEASDFDEEKAEYLNETLLYGIKATPSEFLSDPKESAELVISIISEMLNKEEQVLCLEILEYFFDEERL